MSTQPAGVLAAMDSAAWLLANDSGESYAEPLNAARAAVAELLDADREYDAAIAAYKDLNRRIAEQGWLEVEFDALRNAGSRLVRAQFRREKALACMGGAA